MLTRAPLIDTQTFTASGTWTKPANSKYFNLLLIGAGGGGASGQYNTAGGFRVPGIGGGAGDTVRLYRVPASALPSASYAVTVGAGGAGGVGKTATNQFPNSGVAGGTSSIGPFSAAGGEGGYYINAIQGNGAYDSRGLAASVADLDYAFGPSPASLSSVVRFLQPDETAVVDNRAVEISMASTVPAGYDQAFTYRALAPTNGGRGSWIDNGNIRYDASLSTSIVVPGVAYTAPPTPPSTDGNGVAGSTFASYYGYGGSGAAWLSSATPFTGGAGGLYGGGGGGGCGTTSPTTTAGGTGGAGAGGVVVVWAFG